MTTTEAGVLEDGLNFIAAGKTTGGAEGGYAAKKVSWEQFAKSQTKKNSVP